MAEAEIVLFYFSLVMVGLFSLAILTQVLAAVVLGLSFLCKCKWLQWRVGHEEPGHAVHAVFSDQMDSGFEESDSETSSFSDILIIENENGGPLEEQLD